MKSEYFQLIGIDDETLTDFLASLHESLDGIEHELMVLERDPKNTSAINSIFRAMHIIKGNCRLCDIGPFVDYTHAIEGVFSQLRSKQFVVTPHIKEAILLGLDKLRTNAEAMTVSGQIRTAPLEAIGKAYTKLTQTPTPQLDLVAADIIRLIGGDAATHLPLSELPTTSHVNTHPAIKAPDMDADLKYFEKIALATDENSPFWEGRCKLTLSICLGINQKLDNPVDTRQLTAASYIHDIGMAYIPYHIINKAKKLNTLEERKIRAHIEYSYEWLVRVSGWESAAQMILQHHERPDGTGYPNRVKGDEICVGAKILAIADTFYATTNERADRSYKRSLLRAITEINGCVDTQFDSEVTNAFNKMVRLAYPTKSNSSDESE